MNKTKYFISLAAMLFGCTAVNAAAKASLSSVGVYSAANDTVDIDEEEFIASKDVSKLSRINRAQQEGQLNARDYIIENRFLPSGDTFTSNSFWDHFYFMAGFGLQKIGGIEGLRINPMENAHLGVGKNFNPLSSARFYVNIENGLRWYKHGKTSRFNMFNGNLDYLYNLSTYFAGYNPQRPVNVSAFGGIGFGFTRSSYADGDPLADDMKGLKFSANAHFGLSIGVYGGPRSYFSVEPYLGVATDQIDNSVHRNWHNYDLFYGVRATYAYYLRDHNSPEAWDRIRSSWHYAGLTDVEKMRVWQNPYFVEFQAGPSVMTKGHTMSYSVGKWFSPAFGMRAGITGRNAEHRFNRQADGYRTANRYNWNGIKVEGLVNPFGFGKYYDWNLKYGAYLVGGLSIGRMNVYNRTLGDKSVALINIEGGVHGWFGVDKGVQLFVEPHITRYEGTNGLPKRYAADVNIGFTVTSEARKYRDTYLPEELPIYPNVASRLTLGVGASYVQRQQQYYPYDGHELGSPLGGFQLFGEYRFNHYYSARMGLEYINMNDVVGNFRNYAVNHASHMALFNVAPVFHLASLMRGVDPYRKWDVDGSIGLTASWLTGETASMIYGNSKNIGQPIDSDMKLGGHASLRLSYRFTNQASVYVMPTVYFLQNVKYGNPTPDMKKWQSVQTFNVGVQYALAPAKRLSAFEDSLDIERWRDPLFVEASSGITLTSAINQNGDGNSKLGIGYETSLAVGKWFAPIAGFRGTLTRRSTEWGYYDWASDPKLSAHKKSLRPDTEYFVENYLGARVDLLINPMGFFREFTWDDPWGVYGFVGIGMGQKRMHRYMTEATVDKQKIDDGFGVLKQSITSLNFGIHPWLKLSDDVNVFLEYLYSTASSTRPQDQVFASWKFDDNSQGRHSIKIGFGMNLRTEKYREMRDISAMYDFKPWLSSRLRFGIAGGFNMFHVYKGHTNNTYGMRGFVSGFQGMLFGEYRISDYFAGRLTYEYVGRGNIQQAKTNGLGLLSASFNANLTTLMGGFRPRTTEYDAFIGPTVFFQDGKAIRRIESSAWAKDCSIGVHAGIRISRTVADHLAVFAQPTIYVLNRGGQHHFLGKSTLMQTINLGVHYTLR